MTHMPAVIDRLVSATNAHDLDALVACFAPDFVNVTPAHPPRSFTGRDQVRQNWLTIFTGVPDITARIVASAVDGSAVWTEWEMTGTRLDGTPHAMSGVVVFGTRGDEIGSARFFLEPVESESGDVNAAVARSTHTATP